MHYVPEYLLVAAHSTEVQEPFQLIGYLNDDNSSKSFLPNVPSHYLARQNHIVLPNTGLDLQSQQQRLVYDSTAIQVFNPIAHIDMDSWKVAIVNAQQRNAARPVLLPFEALWHTLDMSVSYADTQQPLTPGDICFSVRNTIKRVVVVKVAGTKGIAFNFSTGSFIKYDAAYLKPTSQRISPEQLAHLQQCAPDLPGQMPSLCRGKSVPHSSAEVLAMLPQWLGPEQLQHLALAITIHGRSNISDKISVDTLRFSATSTNSVIVDWQTSDSARTHTVQEVDSWGALAIQISDTFKTISVEMYNEPTPFRYTWATCFHMEVERFCSY